MAPLGAALMLSGCGSIDAAGRDWLIDQPEASVRSELAALAACRSPLQRLAIARPLLHVEDQVPGRVTLAISATTAARTSTMRFKIAGREGQPAAGVRLTWTFALADEARELDLGPGRLLNPPVLVKNLETAVDGYIDTMGLPQTAALGRKRERACRQIGRLLDAIAATSDPELRRTLERQKRRDALGWLFEDNYQLKTDSPETADWETEADYPEYSY